MSWTCFMDEEQSWQPGAMWYVDVPESKTIFGRALAPEYWRDNSGRRPVIVMLPGRNSRGEIVGWPFCVDTNASDSDHGWVVSGTPPGLTVSPSINAVGVYHGWLTGGVISDGVT